MQRVLSFVIVGLILVSCDPIHHPSAVRRIPAPLQPTCIVEALRMEETVQRANVFDSGLWAVIKIPEPLKSPQPESNVHVDQSRNEKGELEIVFEMTWLGSSGSPEYRAYVQKVLEELRDRTIEKCGSIFR